MRPDYDGIKFYGRDDWSLGENLKLSESIVSSFNPSGEYTDINAVIELYNIQQLYDTGATLTDWTESDYSARKKIVSSMTSVIGKFFSKINNDNFAECEGMVSIGYFDDFWELFVRFKVFNRVTPESFLAYMELPDTTLYKILEHKELVTVYDEQIATVLRVSNQTVRILSAKYLEKTPVSYYLPRNLLPNEYEGIFQQYIDSGNANPNILQLIMNFQSTKECPISDRLRLNAKKANEHFWETKRENAIHTDFGIGVGFANQTELKKYENEGLNYQITYNVKWFEDNLDFPTILNNYWYLFEMFDGACRSNLVSVKSKISVFEDVFSVKGVRFYPRGNQFNAIAMLSNAQTMLYYDFLSEHGINLENVFKWFFEDYLSEEFSVLGFSMVASSSAASYVEKCRNIAGEMDGILKQYRMYVRDGVIDRELYEMSSEHMVIDTLPSTISGKYAYSGNDDIKHEMSCLFSNQTTLAFTDTTQTKYSTLFELLTNENVKKSQFKHFQKPAIEWLEEHGCVAIGDDETVRLSFPKVYILRDLYEHDVICVYKFREWKKTVDQMVMTGELRIEDTLFTEPERDYLNYELNKSEFSDGLDLRNKYAHSTYPKVEQEQRRDYMELLKIMVLIITKINDEFCMKEEVTP